MKPTWKQNDLCNSCGLSGNWSRTYRTPKHFVDLYQASMKQNGKKFESHSNTLGETNVEANNALVTDDSNNLVNIKDLDVSDFFEDPDGKIDYLIGCDVFGSDN